MEEQKQITSNILKCGRRTYFFDLKQASNGSTYLKITESWFAKENQPGKRNSFILFKDDVEKFVKKIKSFEGELINVGQKPISKTEVKG